MAKEQIAVAELITNIILGKTDGASRVDFFPQKPKFPFDKPYEQPFPRATPESQGISVFDMLPTCCGHLDDLHTIQICTISSGSSEIGKGASLGGQAFRPLPQPNLACDPFHVQKHHRHGNWSSG